MIKRITILFILSMLSFSGPLLAQDLDSIINAMEGPEKPKYVISTFKSTRVIIGQSVEVPVAGDLTFIISHRFGHISGGFYDFFGLDQAYNRLGLEYGILDRFGVVFGRNSFQKTYDGAIKAKILRQQTGPKNIPVTMTLYSSMYVNTTRWQDTSRVNLFSSRLSYAHQLIIARKFGKKISLQLTPTFIHKNLVELVADQNNIFAVGAGGKWQFVRKVSVNMEYYWLAPGKTADDFNNCLSIGFDFETGGHVFQLHLSNSRGTIEPNFITETTGRWLDGDIFLGFNIYRVFPLSEKRKNIY